MTLNKILIDTRGMNKKQIVTYLKDFTGRQLNALIRENGVRCSKNVTRIISLQHTIKLIEEKRIQQYETKNTDGFSI